MQVALYKNVKYDFETVANGDFSCDDYVRISELVDVEFPLLPYGESEKFQINIIDKQIKSVMADAEQAINRLETRKAELLALPGTDG